MIAFVFMNWYPKDHQIIIAVRANKTEHRILLDIGFELLLVRETEDFIPLRRNSSPDKWRGYLV